jgi:hypothetical protein
VGDSKRKSHISFGKRGVSHKTLRRFKAEVLLYSGNNQSLVMTEINNQGCTPLWLVVPIRPCSSGLASLIVVTISNVALHVDITKYWTVDL